MPRRSVFNEDAPVSADGATGVWWRRSAAADVSSTRITVIDGRVEARRATTPLPSALLAAGGQAYVFFVRLVATAGRIVVQLSDAADSGYLVRGPELTAAARRDLRWALRFKNQTLAVQIADDSDEPYAWVPPGTVVRDFVSAVYADPDRATEPVTLALLDGGAGSPVDFSDLTVPGQVLVAANLIGGNSAMTANLTVTLDLGGGATALPTGSYRTQLQALLPPGAAWPRGGDAVLTGLLDALAAEFHRADARAASLVEEADPHTAHELLPDWERAAGLPDECYPAADSLARRRRALVSRLTHLGGQSRRYFISLAAALGYDVAVTEFTPHDVTAEVTAPLYGQPWRFAWQVSAPPVTVFPMTVSSGVDEPLAAWGNEWLECAVRALAPAHTIVLFTYGARHG